MHDIISIAAGDYHSAALTSRGYYYLFYFILFYFILFYFILFYFILFYFIFVGA